MSRARPVPLLVTLLVTTVAVRASAQPPARATPSVTATIFGQVIDGGSGQPIPSAIVTLDRSTRVMTTGDGRFVFRSLDPGDYRVSAMKSGYLPGEPGGQRAGGESRLVSIAAGQRRRDVVIRLWRHAAITGTVVDEAGEPLIGVSVTALRRKATGGRVKFVMEGSSGLTDDRGMYRIARLVPGTYVVTIRAQHVTGPAFALQHAKDGFLEAAFGRNPAGGMRLQKALVEIDGFMAFDGNFHTRQIGDHLQMMSPEMPTPPPADGTPLLAYPTVYYPNAVSMSAASRITVVSGQERSGVNLQVTPVPTARVSGTISAPAGSAAYVTLRLIPADAEDVDGHAISTISDDNGRFTFLAVPSGDYTLRALDMPPPVTFFGHFTIFPSGASVNGIAPPASPATPDDAPSTLWASAPLSVRDTDVTDVNMALKNGFTIAGEVQFEGSERPTTEQMSETAIYLQPADNDMDRVQLSPAKVDKAGHFTTMALPPGKYVLHVMAAGNWSMKGAVASDRDIAGVPLEIESRNVSNVVFTLTDRPTVLSGRVHGSEDALRRGAVVVAFPTDSTTWNQQDVGFGRIRKAPVAENGRYEFQALFPGDYYVAAIPAAAADDWLDPALLQQLVSGAARVTIGDGEKVSSDVRLQEPR
jgi:uncharacterized protein (DUF2141 family)